MEEAEPARPNKQASKRKRDASISPPPLSRESTNSQKKARIEPSPPAESASCFKGVSSQSPEASRRTGILHATGIPSASGTRASTFGLHNVLKNLEYPRGIVKTTKALFHDSQDAISFEAVVRKENLKIAVFSSYQWDLDWLFGKIDMRKTKLNLVMGVKTKHEEDSYRREAAEQGLVNVRLYFPKLLEKGHSIMHSKLMLLIYEKHMRIVIPTANLVPYDWGETGFVENTVFLVDLPRRTDGNQPKLEELSGFGAALHSMLQHMDMPKNIVDGVLKFDYSDTHHLGLVYSAAGEHAFDPAADPPTATVGYMGLHRTIKDMGLSTVHASLDYVTSSLGLLDIHLLKRVQRSARGHNSGPQNPGTDIRVYFPSYQAVKDTMGGFNQAGTICLQRKFYENPIFKREVLRDFHCKRIGLLSHSKILFVRGKAAKSDGAHDGRTWVSWAYVGSANLTSSAWCTMITKGKEKQSKQFLQCRNWECGVVVPGRVVDAQSVEGMPDLETMFEGIVDIPFEQEDLSYDGKEPWMFDRPEPSGSSRATGINV